MKLNRRTFLGSLLATGVSATAAASTENTESFLFREQSKDGFSIMQSMTDETSTQLSLLLPKASEWTIEVSDGAGRLLPFTTEVFTRAYSDHAVHNIYVEGLKLSVVYALRVKAADGRVVDQREFRALDLSERPVKVGMLSCILDLLHRDDIWQRMESQPLDAVLFLGDNVYADRTSFLNKNPADERQLWERYVITRNRVRFYFRKKLVPVLATWDDHDFGADNAYRNFPAAAASRVVFETFFPQRPRPSLVAGPGIARRWRAFGADFVFLDGRSFRDDTALAGAKIFGEEQERWLLDGAEARPTWLLNGSMFFGAYQTAENFEGSYPADFARFLSALAKSPATYCFASGDVHFSEVMDIESTLLGYPSFELVASSVHSYTFPGWDNRFYNSRRRSSTTVHNFVVFDGEFGGGGLEGQLISHSATGVEFKELVRLRR